MRTVLGGVLQTTAYFVRASTPRLGPCESLGVASPKGDKTWNVGVRPASGTCPAKRLLVNSLHLNGNFPLLPFIAYRVSRVELRNRCSVWQTIWANQRRRTIDPQPVRQGCDVIGSWSPRQSGPEFHLSQETSGVPNEKRAAGWRRVLI